MTKSNDVALFGWLVLLPPADRAAILDMVHDSDPDDGYVSAALGLLRSIHAQDPTAPGDAQLIERWVSVADAAAGSGPAGLGPRYPGGPRVWIADATVATSELPIPAAALAYARSIAGAGAQRAAVEAARRIAAGGSLDRAEFARLLDRFAPTIADVHTSTPTNRAGRRARTTRASLIDTAPVVWAWSTGADQGRIAAGSLSLAAGREGTGKSSFAIWFAAQVSRGRLPGSFHGDPRDVLYVAVEDSWKYTMVPRLVAAGADLDRVHRLDISTGQTGESPLDLPTDLHELESAIRSTSAALVVIDPLSSAIGAGIDTHRERDVRGALDPLLGLADRTGCCILGIAHFNKSAGTDAATLITGSGAFKNVPRSLFGFAVDQDKNHVMTQVKNSLGRLDLPSLAYRIAPADVITTAGPITTVARFDLIGESESTVEEILGAGTESREQRAERSELEKWILEYLGENGGTAPAKDVQTAGRAAGYTLAAIDSARRRCRNPRILSSRDGFGKGSYVAWSIDTT